MNPPDVQNSKIKQETMNRQEYETKPGKSRDRIFSSIRSQKELGKMINNSSLQTALTLILRESGTLCINFLCHFYLFDEPNEALGKVEATT